MMKRSYMLVLAIDTCEARGSIALLLDDAVLQIVSHPLSEEYSSWLIPTVEAALEAAGKALAEVDLFAVATGPGSFTGVRIGLTTVKAWSEVFDKPIAAMSRSEVLAAEGATNRFVASFIDANRGQIFSALYKRDGQELILVGEELLTTIPEFVASIEGLAGSELVAWASTDPALISEDPLWQSRAARGEEIQSVRSVLAPLIGKHGVQKALKGQLLDALTLDANYVRPSYVEASKKRSPETQASQSVKANAEFLIRSYAPGDSEQVLAICASAPEAAQWSKASYDQAAASGQIVVVAEVAGKLQGFLVARVVGDEAEILNMAVEGKYRRKKLGTQLLKAGMKEFRSRSAEGATRVFLEVRESNRAGIAFYEKHGFCKNGKRPGYYRDPTEDAVLMEKKLTD